MVMKIAVGSGKGGVGKSTFISSLALLLSKNHDIVLVDADADCPDLQILFAGQEEFRKMLKVSKNAKIDYDKCTKCGKCAEACKFNAIDKDIKINPFFCEGCGACAVVCPENAITLEEQDTGEIVYIPKTNYDIPLLYVQLLPGNPNSGKLVYEVKAKADELAKEVTFIDCAAGIGCPVIASLTGCNYLIGIVEPTTASFEDLKRFLLVADHFRIPYSIVINKSGISDRNEKMIVDFADKNSIEILGKIPYDKKVIEMLAMKKPVVLEESKATDEIKKIAEKVEEIIKGNK